MANRAVIGLLVSRYRHDRASVSKSSDLRRRKSLRGRLSFRGLIFYPVAWLSEHEEFALCRRVDATQTRVWSRSRFRQAFLGTPIPSV